MAKTYLQRLPDVATLVALVSLVLVACGQTPTIPAGTTLYLADDAEHITAVDAKRGIILWQTGYGSYTGTRSMRQRRRHSISPAISTSPARAFERSTRLPETSAGTSSSTHNKFQAA